VKEKVPSTEGVPLIAPLEGLIDTPAGRAPPMTANWYTPVPPEATTAELYATPGWMVVPGAHSTESAASAGFC
jgi:hypothetical protein